jgi:2,3,4,5-tetrahydropyridine-2-carboxylate N-succinyltransferase
MKIDNKEGFNAFVADVEARDGYRRPLAFGVGIAHVSAAGNILDTFFPFPNLNSSFGSAAAFADVVGHLAGTASYELTAQHYELLLEKFTPFLNDGGKHPNIEALTSLFAAQVCFAKKHSGKILVVAFVDDSEHDAGPQTVPDAYLRLHLLSHRLVKPNGINLEGIFGKLPNVVWTNEGPIAPEDLPARRLEAMIRRHPLHVSAVDKFPRMVDYVIPSGVRIADGARVRLGAYLGEGTTVMHEGFCNFNAGTLGKSMVEGRISAGVVVGDQTDIGGGASLMGTLSGGGKEKVVVARGCLIGANAGIGISLGDRCVVEAGLYLTAGMKVVYNGKGVKAIELSGKDGLTFRRHSLTGFVEALDKPNDVVLNEILHKN